MKTRVVQDGPREGRGHGSSADVAADPCGARPPSAGLRSSVRAHPLVTFFVLSCAFSWVLLPIGTFLPPGPLLAAVVVVSLTDGRTGLRRLGGRLLRWRVGWVWYAAAVGIPLTVHLATVALNLGLGAAAPAQDQFSPWYAVLVVMGLRLVTPLDGALGEEPGFRGYAQPRLQLSRSPLVATSALAGFVALWHVPLLFVGADPMRPVDLLGSVAVTFFYAWLFNHAAGSVLLTLLAHATEGSVQTGAMWPAGADGTRISWLYALVWCCVAAGLVALDRTAWRRAPAYAVEPPSPGSPS